MSLYSTPIITTFLSLLLVALLDGCHRTKPKNLEQQPLKIGKIPNWAAFKTMNAQEEKLAATMPTDNALSGRGAFKDNRTRIYIDKILKNNVPEKLDSLAQKGHITPCDCYLKGDNLRIHAGTGAMGGFGIDIIVHEKQFSSGFYIYMNAIKPYKAEITDSSFHHTVNVLNEDALFILQQSPKFELGEIINGYLSFKSRPFYEQLQSEQLDKRRVEGRMYLTCKVREKMIWE